MTGSARSLSQRINAIMTSPRKPRARSLALTVAVGALVAVATPLAALELAARDADPGQVQAAAAASVAATALVVQATGAAPVAPVGSVAPVAAVAPVADTDAYSFSYSSDGYTASLAPQADGSTRRQTYTYSYSGDGPAPLPPVPPAPPAPPRLVSHQAPVDRVSYVRAAQDRAGLDADRAASRRDREQAIADARAAREDARQHRQRAEADSRAASADARAGRAAAREALAGARDQMRSGANEMERGAETMRDEARKLQNPAYRAERIAEARAQGRTVTDAQLQALSPRLATQADELVARARQLRQRSEAGSDI